MFRSISSGSCGRVLLLSPELCSLFWAWVWLSPCSQGSLERIFCREQHHFWGSILNPFMAVFPQCVVVNAEGWLWQERFVPTALCPSDGHLPF